MADSAVNGVPAAEVADSKPSKAREADWPAVLFFIHVHLLSLYGLWLLLFEVQWLTALFLGFLTSVAALGVTAGAHRLWAHGAYRACTALRIALMLCQTMAGQGSVYEWVRRHRLHHQQFATDADPYDSTRGFLYAHFLTRLRKLSPHQQRLADSVDMSDLETDGVVMFQKKMYWLLYAVLFVLLPLNAPLEYWGDSVLSAVFVVGFLRYGVVLHVSWLVESGICVWGLRQGQKSPPDSNSVFILSRTFWPHYHYLVPYDYKSGEYGTYDSGCTTAFIRVFAALRLATDLRTVDPPMLQKALAMYARTKQPLQTCLDQLASKQAIREDQFFKRG